MKLGKIKLFIFTSLMMGLWGSFCRASSFAELQKQIEESHVNSVEQLLPLLPPNLRSKYVLLFRSRSLQGASPENPRVLLFGDDAKLILSFNGSPEERGYHDIEVAEFDNAQKQFVFHEIQFPDVEKNRQQVKISPANPEKCLRCHGNPARAIWDTYPLWPGAYGQVYHAPLAPTESKALTQFLALQPQHPRYRYLLGAEIFARNETFAPTTNAKYEGRDRRLPPNADLGLKLSGLNLQMMAKQVAESAAYPNFQYALLASLDSDCGNLDVYLPKPLRESWEAQFPEFFQATEKSNKLEEAAKKIRLGEASSLTTDAGEKTHFVAFRFLAERGLGLKTGEWTQSLEKDTYDYSSINTPSKALEHLLLIGLEKNDPELRRIQAARVANSDEKYCDFLKRKSQESLALVQKFNSVSLPNFAFGKTGEFALLQKCAGCHDGVVGREIHFTNPTLLSRELNENHYQHGTLLKEILYRISPESGDQNMPRGMNLESREREELIKYFTNLNRHIANVEPDKNF